MLYTETIYDLVSIEASYHVLCDTFKLRYQKCLLSKRSWYFPLLLLTSNCQVYNNESAHL